jgi:hypothetical protein
MMAVIVIGGIALIGYKAIGTISDKSCQAEKASFKIDLEGLIEKYTSYGSVNRKTINSPCEYDTVCFVDVSKIGINDGSFTCPNRIIQDSVTNTGGIEANMFVLSNKRTISIGYSDLITLNSSDRNSCLCIEQRNKNFYITFSGKGSSTEISRG